MELKQEVIVTDIKMNFGSMVIFMVKWAIAAIPAILILIGLVTAAGIVIKMLIIDIPQTVGLSSSTTAPFTFTPYLAKVVTPIGTIRVSPANSSRVIVMINAGSSVMVTDSDPPWLQIKVGGKTGWIHDSEVKKLE